MKIKEKIKDIKKDFLIKKLYDYLKLKRKSRFTIYDFFKETKNRNVFLPVCENQLSGRKFVFDKLNFNLINSKEKIDEASLLIGFGYHHTRNNSEILYKHKDKPILMFEESFLRSIVMHESKKEIEFEYVRAMFFDDLWFHFDCHKTSRLEMLLNIRL